MSDNNPYSVGEAEPHGEARPGTGPFRLGIGLVIAGGGGMGWSIYRMYEIFHRLATATVPGPAVKPSTIAGWYSNALWIGIAGGVMLVAGLIVVIRWFIAVSRLP